MDRVALDIFGPLVKMPRRSIYLLVIIDYFTRWVEAYELPDQQAATIAEPLVHQFISRFGCPLEIHTDQGRNFESQLLAEMCRVLNVRKTRITPYHPSSNRLVERFNKTMARMIKSFIEANPTNWDLYVPLLTAAYRSTKHLSTG